jgi:hypothetical protein
MLTVKQALWQDSKNVSSAARMLGGHKARWEAIMFADRPASTLAVKKATWQA